MYKRTKLRKQLRARRLLRELEIPALCIAYTGIAAATILFCGSRADAYLGKNAEQAGTEPIAYVGEVNTEELPTAGFTRAIWKTEVAPVQPEEEAEEETEEEGNPTVEEEIELLAHAIYAEVGSIKDDACLYACGSVILNRVAAEDFPDTIYGVLYQTEPTLQYACTVNGALEKDPDDRCMEIAEDLLRYGTTIPADVIYMAEFNQGSGVYAIYNNVVFCYR